MTAHGGCLRGSKYDNNIRPAGAVARIGTAPACRLNYSPACVGFLFGKVCSRIKCRCESPSRNIPCLEVSFMFDRMAGGFDLARSSWHVLREDKKLIVFPIISGVG